jgi:hypothetical protein
MNINQTYITLQIFNVIGGALNFWFLIRNIQRGSWMGAISAVATLAMVVCFIFNWRRMAHYRREERQWKVQADAMLRNDRLFRTMSQLSRCPELELEMCYQRGICPDCGKGTLDQEEMFCTDATCGSRFTISPTGAWSRA